MAAKIAYKYYGYVFGQWTQITRYEMDIDDEIELFITARPKTHNSGHVDAVDITLTRRDKYDDTGLDDTGTTEEPSKTSW